MEMKLPGASGWLTTAFAGLPTPPMEGVVGLACNAPPMLCVPERSGTSWAASTVITTCGLLLLGCQVALQFPLFRDVSGSDGSPSEKEAVTLPDVMKFPQSSTDRKSTR